MMSKVAEIAPASLSPLQHRLLWVAWELPCYGLALWALIRVNTGRFGLTEVITLLGFLGFVAIFRLAIRPLDRTTGRIGYALAVLCSLTFAAILLYESARVRARWYRSTVLEVRISTIFAEAPIPIVIGDQHGRITGFNRQAEKLTGHSREEVIGQDVEMLIPPERLSDFRAAYGRSVDKLRSEPAEWFDGGESRLKVRCKDGDVVECNFYAFGVRYGPDVDMFGIFRPVPTATRSDQARGH